MTAILEVSDLSKRFGGVQAVNKLSFSVDAGEILGLIGPNGSGKSTTLSLLMGVQRADDGHIRCQGRDVRKVRLYQSAAHGLAMVFQHSRPLKRQTTIQNIKLALLSGGLLDCLPRPALTRRAREVADWVGLSRVADVTADQLSFSELRRLEFAKALALEPRVLLLDEPFAGLAPAEVRQFITFIREFQSPERGIVLVDHNVKAVAGLVDRVVAMHQGARIAEGTADEVMRDAKVREVFLGTAMEDRTGHKRTEAPRADAPPLLSTRIDGVRYGKAEALQEVYIDVAKGEFVSVVGLNGAGKTSLFNAITGFVDYQGDVLWQGSSIKGRSSASISRSGIAHCPEDRKLFRYMSVEENLELGGFYLDRKAKQETLGEVFELFPRLAERRWQLANTLSGGEQQMLTIARGLMLRPQLLILDEPTLGLAPLIMDSISDALETLRTRFNTTILLAEQNLHFALRHSERIFLLENGVISWRGDTEAFESEVGESYI
ncbi:ATP-binding cassette domain-containing protein [Salinisphaera sp. RV14]|uniref:ATP-binding cassette domain-containing protein n=1 Tax=Salinisphaera sp. RV14 TaxID=3454140 RepID=UPI003F86C27C